MCNSSRLFRCWAFCSYGRWSLQLSAFSFELLIESPLSFVLHVAQEPRSFEQYAAMLHCNSIRLEAEGSKLKAHSPLGFVLIWGGAFSFQHSALSFLAARRWAFGSLGVRARKL